MSFISTLKQPTLLLDEQKCKANIKRMADKAREQDIVLRPHFKTHQSAVVGEWYRDQGIDRITVSSVTMAQYFAEHGWRDILIAFPVNWHEVDEINELAARVRLGLLVDSAESIRYLAKHIKTPVGIWLKVDTGINRAGIPYNDTAMMLALAKQVHSTKNLRLEGLLTHAGHTYKAAKPGNVATVYATSVAAVNVGKHILEASGVPAVKLSVGDTPGCTLSPSLGEVDEIRPGNFVFYDGQMLCKQVCEWDQIAMVLACPIVSVQPERNEVIVYGGAIHFSKDNMQDENGVHHGNLVRLNADGSWNAPVPGGYLARQSQEHGVIHVPNLKDSGQRIGDWVGIIPAHVCLTVSAMQKYTTLGGQEIKTFA